MITVCKDRKMDGLFRYLNSCWWDLIYSIWQWNNMFAQDKKLKNYEQELEELKFRRRWMGGMYRSASSSFDNFPQRYYDSLFCTWEVVSSDTYLSLIWCRVRDVSFSFFENSAHFFFPFSSSHANWIIRTKPKEKTWHDRSKKVKKTKNFREISTFGHWLHPGQ